MAIGTSSSGLILRSCTAKRGMRRAPRTSVEVYQVCTEERPQAWRNQQFPCASWTCGHGFGRGGWTETEMRLQGSALSPIPDNFDEPAVRLCLGSTTQACRHPGRSRSSGAGLGSGCAGVPWHALAALVFSLKIGLAPSTVRMTRGMWLAWGLVSLPSSRSRNLSGISTSSSMTPGRDLLGPSRPAACLPYPPSVCMYVATCCVLCMYSYLP
jgi:hypothetical protein